MGRFDQFELTFHALQRMRERNATRWDICLALRSATIALHQEGDRWRLEGGRDDDGEPLGLVVVFTGRGLIVTVL